MQSTGNHFSSQLLQRSNRHPPPNAQNMNVPKHTVDDMATTASNTTSNRHHILRQHSKYQHYYQQQQQQHQQRPYNSLPLRQTGQQCSCTHKMNHYPHQQEQNYRIEQSNQTDYSDPRAIMMASDFANGKNQAPNTIKSYGETQTDTMCLLIQPHDEKLNYMDEADRCGENEASIANQSVQSSQQQQQQEKRKRKRFFKLRVFDSKSTKSHAANTDEQEQNKKNNNKRSKKSSLQYDLNTRGTQTKPICIIDHQQPNIGDNNMVANVSCTECNKSDHHHQMTSMIHPADPTATTVAASPAMSRHTGTLQTIRYNRPQSSSIECQRQIVPRIPLPLPCLNDNEWNTVAASSSRTVHSPIIQTAYSPAVAMTPASSVASLDIVSETLVNKFDSIRSSGIGWMETCNNDRVFLRRKDPIISSVVPCSNSFRPETPTDLVGGIGGSGGASLANDERNKIQIFYNSVGSYVYVSTSAAVLFTNQLDATLRLTEWKRLYVGVPIWLFNTGVHLQRPRRLQLVMAELGSGFILIDATVDHSSDVGNPRPGYLTLKMKDGKNVIALRFFTISAADAFYTQYRLLYQDKRNIDIFRPNEIPKRSKYRPELYWKKEYVSKKAISNPTSFRHLSSLNDGQRENLYSLTALT